MQHEVICKFCKRPGKVTVDIDYIGDPFRLIEKYCCNECADVRVSKRVLEERVSRVATEFAALRNPSDSMRLLTRKKLFRLLESYARMICRWNRLDGMAFDEEAVNVIMEHPSQWADVLSNLWKTFNDWKHQQQQKELEV